MVVEAAHPVEGMEEVTLHLPLFEKCSTLEFAVKIVVELGGRFGLSLAGVQVARGHRPPLGLSPGQVVREELVISASCTVVLKGGQGE